MTSCDVAIIGAGPYGLSAAAHLRIVKGLEVRVFGQPMSFWSRNMPDGMLLRSNWSATHIADPDGILTLEAFQAARAHPFSAPVPLSDFLQYGLWYQQQAVPDLDLRTVARIDLAPGGFRLHLKDGEALSSRRVIIAAGIGPFAYKPPETRDLPPSLCTHTSEHYNLGKFAGRTVLVVGGGQSALESGALLREAQAEVEIVVRTPQIHWLQGWASRTLHHRLGSLTRQLLYAPTDVGPAGISQVLARPDLVRRLPRAVQDKLRKRATRPAGARWLVERLQTVPIKLGRSVVSAVPSGGRVKVRLDEGSEKLVDHLLLGTGYRVDISKYEFLSPKLVQSIRRFGGYPWLKDGFETSVAGLHVIGAPATWSFGPLLQFVSGTHYAGQALLRSMAGKAGIIERDRPEAAVLNRAQLMDV
jgi:cation diffusion facilitator CzcD-associated flavoprotein CzcO